MKDLQVTRIEKSFKGYGHNKVTVTVTGKLIDAHGDEKDVEDYELSCVTTNLIATDAYFDEYYDEDLDNEDRIYETRFEAGESLVDEVFRKNDIQSDYELTTVMNVEEVREMRDEIRKNQ